MENENNLINGPHNVVRLEGFVNDTKKIIYLFFDIRNERTECEEILSEDVHKYLLKIFDQALYKNKNITYDFFLEIPLKLLDRKVGSKGEYRGQMYLTKIDKLFKNLKENKIIKNKYVNIRAHFVDIRQTLSFGMNLQTGVTWFNTLKEISDSIWKKMTYTDQDIRLIISFLSDFEKMNDFILKSLENPKKTNKKINPDLNAKNFFLHSKKDIQQELEIIMNIIYKLKNIYKNNNIKVKINKIINTFTNNCLTFKKYLNKFMNFLQTLLDTYDNYRDYQKLKEEIFSINNFSHQITEFFTISIYHNLIDLYLLRRFLDKDYITNSIYYSGNFHSTYILYNLIKKFDFKITHVANTNKSVKELNKIVSNMKTFDADILLSYFYNNGIQCSDITDFPPLLT